MPKNIGPFLTLMIYAFLLFLAVSRLFINLGSYIEYLYVAIIYLVIGLLVWLERRNLHEFNIDRLSLVLLILSSVFRRRLGVDHENYFLIIIGAAGLAILTTATLNWSTIWKTSFRWLVIGLFAGCLASIPITFIESLHSPLIRNSDPLTRGVFWELMRQGIYELSFTAPIEEILFRGFIWGYLRKLNWEVRKIVLVQAVLFWFLHISRIETPLSFLLSIPILTLVTSELTKRSNQVSASIASHLIINTVVSVLLRS